MNSTLFSSLLTDLASSTGNVVAQGTNVVTQFLNNSTAVYAILAGIMLLWVIGVVRGFFRVKH